MTTFQDVDKFRNMSIEDLAKDGFYFVGSGNSARISCCECKFHISNWEPHQDPRVIHLKTSPGCSMLKEDDLRHHFSSVHERIKTFPSNWASRSRVSHLVLAEAGFCYAGQPEVEIVVCYLCRRRSHQWQDGDSPQEKHQLNCPILFGPRDRPSSGYATASTSMAASSGSPVSPEPCQQWLDFAEDRSEGIESSCDVYDSAV